ncbi:MAG: hypothetical protein ABI556_14680 [Gemmatimonadales bacterium]
MRTSIVVCLMAFLALVWILRHAQVSLGLPIAYLANLLLLHVPGAVAQLFAADRAMLTPIAYTRTGIIFTAIGSAAFVVGVFLVHLPAGKVTAQPAPRRFFWRFCVIWGGLLTVIAFMIHIPSIGAVLSRGGAIWMLGVLLALRSAYERRDRAMAARWLAILTVYPILMLMLGGFMSYGAMVVIIVLSGLAVTVKSPVRLGVIGVILLVAGMSIFLSYFQHRPEIRQAVWNGGNTEERIGATMDAVRDIRLPDPNDKLQMFALDQRLNQNYFAGLAASRIDAGRVNYLYGRSIWEGVQALVPRALWPDKPVVAGSPKVVSEMTGLALSPNTSFGVGNVMEFHINFGIAGVIIGFLLLGVVIGALDRAAAASDMKGDLGRTFLYFLPAVALIQPNGSIVEIISGAASALAAGYAWHLIWFSWPKPPFRASAAVIRTPEPAPS